MYSRSLTLPLLLSLTTLSLTQNVTVPSYCTSGFEAGTDTAIVTVPYTYNQVMSIIGSYKNLTWSGNPDNTVTLNGTDNTVGTARTYDTAGAHVIETILEYSKPPAPGPYNEVHNTALLTVPSYNLSLYIIYDGTVVSSVCNGMASQFNFTAKYCGSNGTLTGQLLHALHTADGLGAGKLLGGANFTSCAALGGNATSTSSGSGSPTVSPYHGAAIKGADRGVWSAVGAVMAVGLAALW